MVGGLNSGVTAVSVGDYYNLTLKGGVVYSWGENGYGQLANGTALGSRATTPAAVVGLPANVMSIKAGGITSYAFTDDHRLFSWGRNLNGEAGIGTTELYVMVPTEVLAPSGFAWTGFGGGGGYGSGIATPVPEPALFLLFSLSVFVLVRRHVCR